ncbi:MAG: gamma-glutamylcyclotransferase [Candidatus Methylomirabilis sp.]|nr:gamma-glutamylcyclotransferase [Deltaproteobacteria bacterium]
MNASEPILLFVYGTLARGESAHALVRPWTLAAEPATTAGRLFALPEGYPALLAEGEGRVRGELLALRADAPLPEIDAYEGDGFLRERAEVLPANGERVLAWRYVWDPARREALLARGRELPGGDWRRR